MKEILYTVDGSIVNLPDIIHSCLSTMNLSYTVDDEGNGIPLVDRLTPDCDSDITRGKEEINYIVAALVDALIMASEVKKCNIADSFASSLVNIQPMPSTSWGDVMTAAENIFRRKE